MITVLKLIPQSKCVLEDLRVIPCETLNFLLFSKKNSVPTSNSQRSTAPNTTITTTPGRSADLTSFLAQTFGFLLLTKNQRLLPWGAPCSNTLLNSWTSFIKPLPKKGRLGASCVFSRYANINDPRFLIVHQKKTLHDILSVVVT